MMSDKVSVFMFKGKNVRIFVKKTNEKRRAIKSRIRIFAKEMRE